MIVTVHIFTHNHFNGHFPVFFRDVTKFELKFEHIFTDSKSVEFYLDFSSVLNDVRKVDGCIGRVLYCIFQVHLNCKFEWPSATWSPINEFVIKNNFF